MKKVLILFLTALLCISIASCDQESTEKPANPSLDSLQNQQTESAEHTQHTGKGTCEICGIKYYDVLVDYVKTKGTKVEGMNNTWKIIKNVDGCQYVIQWNTSEAQGGVTIYSYDGQNYAQIRIQESSVKYAEYSFSGYSMAISGSISGDFDASTVTPDKDPSWTYSYTCKTESDANKVYNKIKGEFTILINEYLVNMLEECELSPQNLGFERFE